VNGPNAKPRDRCKCGDRGVFRSVRPARFELVTSFADRDRRLDQSTPLHRHLFFISPSSAVTGDVTKRFRHRAAENLTLFLKFLSANELHLAHPSGMCVALAGPGAKTLRDRA